MLKHTCRTCHREFYCVTSPDAEGLTIEYACNKKTDEEHCLTMCNCSDCVGHTRVCKSIYSLPKVRKEKFIGGEQRFQ